MSYTKNLPWILLLALLVLGAPSIVEKVGAQIANPPTLEDKLLHYASDDVKNLIASSSLPVLDAIKIREEARNNQAVLDKLDMIISLLKDIKRK